MNGKNLKSILILVFNSYIKNSYNKYSKIKTILYRTEPKYIYDFFEVPILKKENNCFIHTDDVNNILDISHFVIIQGIGGIGKSTLLKHLFINELKKRDLIPIYLELKDLNDINVNDYDIGTIIFERLNSLGSSLKREYLDYALESGCFMFLLDGYDEILTDKKNVFFKKLDEFCDRYNENYFIISSRPYSEFVEFQRFTVLSTCSLDKEQAKSLVEKIEFDKEIKQRFIKALNDELYDKHKSFASNPLLLNIMLLTFDNYAEIPEKLHLFYSNAFETLYSKHDATKAGYKRELKSNLSYDAFKKVFSYFCFITYNQGKVEFSYDDLVQILEQSKICKVDFDINSYIFDLINSLCVLYKEGLNYKFAHRSFQEYFTAVFLKELSDESMKQISMEMIKKDAHRMSRDEVFIMLYDMAEVRYEQNILLPVLKEYEKNCVEKDMYDFYLEKIVSKVRFEYDSDKNIVELWVLREDDNNLLDFILRNLRYYNLRNDEIKNKNNISAKKMLEYLIDEREYEIGQEYSLEQLKKDIKSYQLIKDTWIGDRITTVSKLSKDLEDKHKSDILDLSYLIAL